MLFFIVVHSIDILGLLKNDIIVYVINYEKLK